MVKGGDIGCISLKIIKFVLTRSRQTLPKQLTYLHSEMNKGLTQVLQVRNEGQALFRFQLLFGHPPA